MDVEVPPVARVTDQTVVQGRRDLNAFWRLALAAGLDRVAESRDQNGGQMRLPSLLLDETWLQPDVGDPP